MVEPTESEDKAELDRLVDALIMIKGEIDEGARDRPRLGWAVETVVLQPFADVLFRHTVLFEWPRVEDEFVSTHAVGTAEKDVIVRFQALCHVVSIKNGQLSRLRQAGLAQHFDEHPADGQNRGRTLRSR